MGDVAHELIVTLGIAAQLLAFSSGDWSGFWSCNVGPAPRRSEVSRQTAASHFRCGSRGNPAAAAV